MYSKILAGKKKAEAVPPIDDFPPALPFQLPSNEGAPAKVVLLGASKDWDTMIETVAQYLDTVPAAISLTVPIFLGDRIIDTTLSRSAWPGCVKQYVTAPDNPEAIHVHVTVEAAPPEDDTSSMVKREPPSYLVATGTEKAHAADLASAHPKAMQIHVKTLNSKIITLPFAENLKVEHLKALVETEDRAPASQQRLIFEGKQLEDGRTLGHYGICDGCTIHLVLRLRGDKPVIYLYPPTTTDVSIKLSLSLEWSFSAVYPTTRTVLGQGPEHVQWDVSAQPNGDLECTQTGAKVPYLFWEAETNGNVSSTQPAFSPARPSLSADDTTAVLLPADGVPAYLDRALGALGLSSTQRTDFITYWLGAINRHKHIALRFLPQDEYAPAAPLDITPAPDVVTRVFMLFRGVEDHDGWTDAAARAGQPVGFWRDVVGLSERHADTSVFRVLEWGGMEVK